MRSPWIRLEYDFVLCPLWLQITKYQVDKTHPESNLLYGHAGASRNRSHDADMHHEKLCVKDSVGQ